MMRDEGGFFYFTTLPSSSLRKSHDMLHKHCLQEGKVACALSFTCAIIRRACTFLFSSHSMPILTAHIIHREPCEQQAASYHLISVYSSLLRPGALRVLLWRRVSCGPGILVGR